MKKNNGVGAGKAVCVVESFLAGYGLVVKATPGGAKGDIEVNGLTVAISPNPETEARPAEVVLDAKVFSGRSVADHVAEVNKVLLALGLPAMGVARPQTGSLRASSADYHEVAMRLTQFRRTANPPAAVLEQVRPTITREAVRAANTYSTVASKMVYDWEDLYTIGLVYFVNHWHQYRDLSKSEDANQKLFVAHLRQQYGRWAQVTNSMLRSVLFKNGTMRTDVYMGSPCCGASTPDYFEPAYEVDYDHHEADVEPVFASEAEREKWERRQRANANRESRSSRRTARAALESRLASLGHDRMVFELRRVVKDEDNQDFAARRLAKSMFDEHSKSCSKCQEMLAREAQEAKHESRFLSRNEKLARFVEAYGDLDDMSEAV